MCTCDKLTKWFSCIFLAFSFVIFVLEIAKIELQDAFDDLLLVAYWHMERLENEISIQCKCNGHCNKHTKHNVNY